MNRRTLWSRGFWGIVSLVASHAALAGDDQRGHGIALLPKYKLECGACHVAFPPDMLPADSWRRLLHDLPHHYGADASLDAATVNELATWLTANTGFYRRVGAAPLEARITRSPWFTREHDELPSTVWKRAAVKSAANCAACHTQADRGDFSEDNVHIPR